MPSEMSTGEVLREIDGAAEMFEAWESEQNIAVTPSIHFTGGEPLLYAGFWDALHHAGKAGCSVAVMTNGCLVTDEDALRFRDLGVFEVQISLEGPESLHDAIRGRGSFGAALRGGERLSRAGVNVSANVTLSRINSPFVEKTVEIARKSGFSGIGFSRLVPCGNGGEPASIPPLSGGNPRRLRKNPFSEQRRF